MGQRFESVSRQVNILKDRFAIYDPKFLSYFLPRSLEKEYILPVVVSSLRKKDVEFEVSGYNIKGLQKSFLFSNCLENRFWTYNRFTLFERQELSLCFQSIDFSTRTCYFAKRKKRVEGFFSLFNLLKEKDYLLNCSKRHLIIKSRLLELTRGGFISSCFGNPAYIIKSSSFYRLRSNQSCYRGWFSTVFPYYGCLSYFLLLSFDKRVKPYIKKYKRFSLSRRCKYYYFKNEVLDYYFLLGKPKAYLIGSKLKK